MDLGAEFRLWSNHKDKDERPYWHNSQTKISTYNKPDGAMTPAQRATGWSQTSIAAKDGERTKIYWFNKSNTSQTSWSPPEGWDSDVPSRPQAVPEEQK